MANRYTDVDLMILKRWDEVKALREAFDDLLSRMEGVIEGSLKKVATILEDRKLSSDMDIKRPSIWFWKHDWETRSKKEPGICFKLFDFAPIDYSKAAGDYPTMWLITEEFGKLRMRESSEDFGRAVRAALSPELLTKWGHEDADLSNLPVGRECTNVSESDRVRMVAEPDALDKFVIDRLDEFMELAPAVDQALQKMTRR